MTSFFRSRGLRVAVVTCFVLFLILPLFAFRYVNDSNPPPTLYFYPEDPDAFEGSLGTDLSISILEHPDAWQTLTGQGRTAELNVSMLISMPNERLVGDPNLNWNLALDRANVEYGNDTDQDGLIDEWVAGEDLPLPLLIPAQPVPGPLGEVSFDNPNRTTHYLAVTLRMRNQVLSKQQLLDGKWAETWGFDWSAPSVPTTTLPISSIGDRPYYQIDWSTLPAGDIRAADWQTNRVSVFVCPECNPLNVYGEATEVAPQKFNIHNAFDVYNTYKWNTPWYPWYWLMSAHGWVLGIAGGAIATGVLDIILRRRKDNAAQ